MKTLIVYDSKFGNTERVAQAIGATLSGSGIVPVVTAAHTTERDVVGFELLVVGGPTQGHGLSQALRAFLDSLPETTVRSLMAATFDTRLTWPRILAGSAAVAAARRLENKGARIVLPPESFLVEGSEGPLVEGELERAIAWAHDLTVKVELTRTAVG